MNKKRRQKKCPYCKEWYRPIRDIQPTCTDYNCMVAHADVVLEKKAKKKKIADNKRIKQNKSDAYNDKIEFNWNDKKWLKKTAQDDINKYSRLRDLYERGHKCCTCTNDYGKMDGGHFLPTSGYSSIRYNTNQIHQQCVNCNRHNGGRRPEYREFMINKYGLEYVENLEATKNVLRSYSVEYYQKLIKVVRKKIDKIEIKLKDK